MVDNSKQLRSISDSVVLLKNLLGVRYAGAPFWGIDTADIKVKTKYNACSEIKECTVKKAYSEIKI